MPAIDVTRLKSQANQLAQHFNQPAVLLRELKDLFEFYSNRTQQPKKSGLREPVIPAYNVAKPVLKRLLRELKKYADGDPAQALELADTLWAEPKLEFRLLAAGLLGQIRVKEPQPVIERINKWGQENEEDMLLDTITNQGLANLRAQAPESHMQLVESWLNNPELSAQKLGLRAILPLLEEPRFDNLPTLFRLLTPVVGKDVAELRPYILDAIQLSIHRSAKETAFFLRQNLDKPNPKTTRWLMRRCLDLFPAEIQVNLRTAMKE
ncbi:MAG: DNA alkylation repair protein [Chloroflexi bacterium]|nr:DNA alkylation repair protein [Chloroflexota bacterium]